MDKTDKMNTARKARSKTNPDALLEKALDSFTLSQRETIRERFKSIPVSFRRRYIKVLKGKSRPLAVESFCCECMGWDKAPEEIKNCTSPACSLYLYRPYQ